MKTKLDPQYFSALPTDIVRVEFEASFTDNGWLELRRYDWTERNRGEEFVDPKLVDEGGYGVYTDDDAELYIDLERAKREWDTISRRLERDFERWKFESVFENARAFTLTEIVDADIPPIPCLIEPWLPAGGIGMLYGEDGVGKTFLAVDMALSLAEGTEFLGYKTRQAKVTYIQADMAPAVTQERLQNLNTPAGDNFQIVLGNIGDVMLTPTNKGWVTQVRGFEPDIIIVDTLRAVSSLDENSNDSSQQLYGHFRTLFGNKPTLFFIHHRRKSSDSNAEYGGQSYRGASAWRADCDAAMMIEKKNRRLSVTWEKARICEQKHVPPTYVEMNPETFRFIKSGADYDKVIDDLPDLYTTSTAEWLAAYMKETGASRATAYRKLEKLRKDSPPAL